MRRFLEQTLLRAQGNVYVCSLPNDERDRHVTVRSLYTRELDEVDAFVKKYDGAGRGLFFCVSTVNKERKKDDAVHAVFLFADIDLKDLTLTTHEVETVLSNLPLPPSRVHFSGHGLHAFWYLDAPTADFERVEAANKRLISVVGGDPRAAHAVTLLRVVGSHNTKREEFIEVTVLSDTGTVYTLANLEAWLLTAQPMIFRAFENKASDNHSEENPFLRAAANMHFAAPIDVAARLAAMAHHGEGENAVHLTQLSVVASLMNAGEEEDTIVTSVLEETKRVGDESWNWVQEEAKIRKMCTDWARKHPRVKAESARSTRSTRVVNLASVREERKEEKKEGRGEEKREGKRKDRVHVVLGTGVLAALEKRGEQLIILRDEEEQVWHYAPETGLWGELSSSALRGMLDREIELGCRALNLVSTTRIVNEARAWILRNPELFQKFVEWDIHGKVPTLSGLVDPVSLTISPMTPDDLCTYQIPCTYDPAAACPWWERMLVDCFAGDTLTIAVFQELVGAALVEKKPRELRRAVVLVGPSNSGKSNLLNTVSGLLTEMSNATTIDALEDTHGLMPFLKRSPWLLHEAFDQSKWHFSATVKSLLSGDPVSVNVKNGAIITHRFLSPVFWGANSPPQFKESSRAMENRLKIIQCHVVFEGLVGAGVEARRLGYASVSDFILDKERSGLLNWAIRGYQRAVARGYFEDTEEMAESLHAMRTDSNLVAGFIEEGVDFCPDTMVWREDFKAAFSVWWEENRGEGRSLPGAESLGHALKALSDIRISNDSSLRVPGGRVIAGIRLNETGLDLWSAGANKAFARGDGGRLSDTVGEVNREIPPSWEGREIIQKIRRAHKK